MSALQAALLSCRVKENLHFAMCGEVLFTLSNYGMLRNVVWSTLIITPGQVGVLGIARIIPQLVSSPTREGYEVRPTLPFSLTYDHRIINGVPADRFFDDRRLDTNRRSIKMSQDIPLPQFDSDVQEATLGAWLKQLGDSISIGDVIAEVTTDKANIEVESPLEGILETHLMEEGETVTVGQPIASVSPHLS